MTVTLSVSEYMSRYTKNHLDTVPLAGVLTDANDNSFTIVVDLARPTKVKIPAEQVVEVRDEGKNDSETLEGRCVVS